MELFVNGNKLDITLENEKTVGDVLRSFEEECAKNNATTVSIMLNGTNIDADSFDTAAQTPLAADTKLELSVISESDVQTSLEYEAKIARQIAADLEQIPVQLQSGKDKDASVIISRLADLVDSFCQTTSLAALFPELFAKLSVGGSSINSFFEEFSGILSDFKQALEEKDSVLIGDLAEYEISPRLISLAESVEKGDA
ncbi:MAG: hypothetical protein IJP62_04070 [Treponema sp.]|nr:hypothetical protein [Treponema sp.]